MAARRQKRHLPDGSAERLAHRMALDEMKDALIVLRRTDNCAPIEAEIAAVIAADPLRRHLGVARVSQALKEWMESWAKGAAQDCENLKGGG